MAMNKKGQWVLVGIMVFIMTFIVIVQFIPILKDQIITARSSPYLDCTNSTITTGTKMTCIVTDLTLFYFVGVAIAAAAGYLGGKAIKYRFSPPAQ